MSGAVEVVVPWRSNGCHYREAAWAWCRTKYEYPVTVAEAPPGPWIKALAAMPAVERSEADIIVLADADVWCEKLPEAVQAVADGAKWARPHNKVLRLSEEGTRAYMAGSRWEHFPLGRMAYYGLDAGGMFVTRRETLLEVPMDPRFVGWGSEDWCHGYALQTLLGHAWVGKQSLIHLWHPLQPHEPGDKYGSPENEALWKRYEAARSYEHKMKGILAEARVALDAHEQTLHRDLERVVR